MDIIILELTISTMKKFHNINKTVIFIRSLKTIDLKLFVEI